MYIAVSVHLSVLYHIFEIAYPHQRALDGVDAVRSVGRGRQGPVVFVPAVGGRGHAQFVLTEKIEAGANKH